MAGRARRSAGGCGPAARRGGSAGAETLQPPPCASGPARSGARPAAGRRGGRGEGGSGGYPPACGSAAAAARPAGTLRPAAARVWRGGGPEGAGKGRGVGGWIPTHWQGDERARRPELCSGWAGRGRHRRTKPPSPPSRRGARGGSRARPLSLPAVPGSSLPTRTAPGPVIPGVVCACGTGEGWARGKSPRPAEGVGCAPAGAPRPRQ